MKQRRKKHKAMVKCAEGGCKRLVFPEQEKCWKHKLAQRDKAIRKFGKGSGHGEANV